MLKYNLLKSETNSPNLALLVHGRLGNLSVMSIFKNSIPKDWNILFVEAPYEDEESHKGYSWWIKDSEDKEKQKRFSLNELIETLFYVEESNSLNLSNRVAIGFSQGGAILSLLVQEKPELFSKLALLSSFALNNSDCNPDLSKLEVLVSHGSEDQIITLTQNRNSQKVLIDLGASIQEVLDDTGHKLGRNGMKKLKEWVKE